jgi:DNA-binding CsgD family transcriptional regulator
MLVGNLAEPLIRLGRWREALDLITESLADEPRGIFASTLLLRGELELWQGDTRAAEDDVREARRQFGDGTDVQFTAPMVYIEAELARGGGELALARQRIQAVLHRPILGLAARYVWPLLWLGMRIEADAAAAAPDDAVAAERRDALRALAATVPSSAPPATAYQALLAAETARFNRCDEVTAWQAAVTATRNAQEAYPLCYSLFRLAEAQIGNPARGTELATATAQTCLRLADGLAATTARDLRALAQRFRLRVEQPTPVTAGGPRREPVARFRLTDREREVLTLVAEGQSNGRIATNLFISPKTASMHVSNILAKLGVSTRTEAATTAHRLGLLAVT